MVPLVVALLVACGVLVYLLFAERAMEESRGFLDERQREVRTFVERPGEPGLVQVLVALDTEPEAEETRRLYGRFQRYLQAYFRLLHATNDRCVALRVFDRSNRELLKAPTPLPTDAYPVDRLAPLLWRARLVRPGQSPLRTDLGERMASLYPVYGPFSVGAGGAEEEAGEEVFLGSAVLEYGYPMAAFRRQGRLIALLSVGITALSSREERISFSRKGRNSSVRRS